MAKNKPLLDLSTLAPEAICIAVDGVEYPLKRISDMGVREQAQFIRMGQRIQELYGNTVQQDLREAQQALTIAQTADPDSKLQGTKDLQEQVRQLAHDVRSFDISDVEAAEIEKTVSGFVALIVEAPPDVLGLLHMYQQKQIMEVFTEASRVKTLEVREIPLTGGE